MSESIILQGFRNKEVCSFRRSIVWDIFGPKCTPARFFGYDLTYGDRYGGFLNLYDDDFISGIGIQSPSRDAIKDLLAVAQLVPSAIHLDALFFVADQAFLAGIPDWLPPCLPKPIRVVHDADELIQFLRQG